jgi:hypothetical protein
MSDQETKPEGEQQIVYHVYQHGVADSQGVHFSVNNFPVTFYARPLLLFLQWGLWVIYIAGAAKVQQTCNSTGNSSYLQPFGPLTGFPPIGTWSLQDCSQYYSELWWSVFLQFICVVGSTILWIAMFWDVTSFAKTIMYFHLMSSVLMFNIAFIFTSAVYVIYKNYPYVYMGPSGMFQSGSYSTDYKNACYLICAGSIGNLICNFTYIIWLSWEPNPNPQMPAVDVAADAK